MTSTAKYSPFRQIILFLTRNNTHTICCEAQRGFQTGLSSGGGGGGARAE